MGKTTVHFIAQKKPILLLVLSASGVLKQFSVRPPFSGGTFGWNLSVSCLVERPAMPFKNSGTRKAHKKKTDE
jgi:hypothetical protein